MTLLADRENLFRRAFAAGNRAVDGAVVAGDVGGFAGEEERVINRRAESLLAAFASGFHVAVRAA